MCMHTVYCLECDCWWEQLWFFLSPLNQTSGRYTHKSLLRLCRQWCKQTMSELYVIGCDPFAAKFTHMGLEPGISGRKTRHGNITQTTPSTHWYPTINLLCGHILFFWTTLKCNSKHSPKNNTFLHQLLTQFRNVIHIFNSATMGYRKLLMCPHIYYFLCCSDVFDWYSNSHISDIHLNAYLLHTV